MCEMGPAHEYMYAHCDPVLRILRNEKVHSEFCQVRSVVCLARALRPGVLKTYKRPMISPFYLTWDAPKGMSWLAEYQPYPP